jgi:hypothetical protein
VSRRRHGPPAHGPHSQPPGAPRIDHCAGMPLIKQKRDSMPSWIVVDVGQHIAGSDRIGYRLAFPACRYYFRLAGLVVADICSYLAPDSVCSVASGRLLFSVADCPSGAGRAALVPARLRRIGRR